MVAAAKAFCMKSYSSIFPESSLVMVRVSVRRAVVMAVRVALQIMPAGHDEDAALQADDVDLGSIEARQHRPGDHVGDGAKRRLRPPEIKHAIERAEQRVQLVDAEQNGDPEFGLKRLHQLHHVALEMRIEAEQRLVEQQQPRAASGSACCWPRR